MLNGKKINNKKIKKETVNVKAVKEEKPEMVLNVCPNCKNERKYYKGQRIGCNNCGHIMVLKGEK